MRWDHLTSMVNIHNMAASSITMVKALDLVRPAHQAPPLPYLVPEVRWARNLPSMASLSLTLSSSSTWVSKVFQLRRPYLSNHVPFHRICALAVVQRQRLAREQAKACRVVLRVA